MNNYSNDVKDKLTSLIMTMSASPELFVKDPARDFTRKRKLPFETMIRLLLSMGGNSIYKELLEAHGYHAGTPSTAAFVQQRDKILPTAFEFLFHEFTRAFPHTGKRIGFRLLAVDGSDLNLPTIPDCPDTCFHNTLNQKGYSLLHLNVMYDLCNRLYVDACIQPRRCENENKALTDRVDRSDIKDQVILIGDRNYESYNTFAHIERKGWFYVIRVKDTRSSGILSGLRLPASGEFDSTVRRVLTRKRTKEIRAQPELYRFLPNNSTFEFLDRTTGFYPMAFRIVRLKITADLYDTVITNLDRAHFPPTEIKALYKKPWGIETSFRELKYAVGLTHFHAKKPAYIAQEIFAALIMCNFSEMITTHVVIERRDTQYHYQVNFTVAIHICKHFFRHNARPPDVEALIRKNILPVRPGRKDPRKIRCKTAVSFVYRVA